MERKVLVFDEVDPTAPEAAELIAALDRDLGARYPGFPIHGIDAANFRAAGGVFLIGRLGDLAVVCGALRPMEPGAVEVKRMFVRDGHRGRGFGRAMLAALEDIAVHRGYRTIRLETGSGQPEAIALYASAGYQPIPCYGDHAADPESRCFEKRLAGV
ncbi:MAG: GNAT family N-acetyltransferase [Bryobacteraceae bacterium]